MLIQLNIKLHSSKIIPVAFHSSAFQGTFWYQFWNAWILPEWVTTGMAILAEPPANFHSSGMHQILPESQESGRNLWGTDKTSSMTWLNVSTLALSNGKMQAQRCERRCSPSLQCQGFSWQSIDMAMFLSCATWSTVENCMLLWLCQICITDCFL